MHRWHLRVLPLLGAFLLTAFAQPASEAAPGPDYTYATWNTQGGGVKGKKWREGVATLASNYDIVALQEAGSYSSFKVNVVDENRCTTSTVPEPDPPHMPLEMLECTWELPTTDPKAPPKTRKVFFAETGYISDHSNTRSLAFVVNTGDVKIPAGGAFQYLTPRHESNYDEGDRGLLRLKTEDGPIIYAAHADAKPLGRNVMSLVQKARGDAGGNPWLMMGDFNIQPPFVRPMFGKDTQPQLVASGKSTHKKEEYDYMMSNDVPGYAAERYDKVLSDHYAVAFER